MAISQNVYVNLLRLIYTFCDIVKEKENFMVVRYSMFKLIGNIVNIGIKLKKIEKFFK